MESQTMSNPRDPALWMWAQACELMDDAARLHRQFFRPDASAQAFAAWEPPIDMFEDERELIIVVALPGVTADRVQVSHDGASIIVRGVRQQPLRGSGHIVRQLEIPYGAFERRITLPPGRFEAGTPELVQGCLVLTLTKIGR